MNAHRLPSRRDALGRIAAGAALLAAPALRAAPPAADIARSQHFPFGPVVPVRPLPAFALRTDRGAATDLASLLRGRISAVQLMFAGCSATCPLQGALFAQAQALLGSSLAQAQFVSLTIDPLSDTPAALRAWLDRFGARPGWSAAAPRIEDVDKLVDLLGSGGEPRPRDRSDPHTGQVYIVDARAALVFRTASMPPAGAIVSALRNVALQSPASGGKTPS